MEPLASIDRTSRLRGEYEVDSSANPARFFATSCRVIPDMRRGDGRPGPKEGSLGTRQPGVRQRVLSGGPAPRRRRHVPSIKKGPGTGAVAHRTRVAGYAIS